MGVRLARLRDALVEVDADRLLAHERRPVLEDERRDRVGGGRLAQGGTRLTLDGDLPDDVVDAELGEPFPNARRGGTPLGLEQL
ncbi:MAG TPA: hypothetical protein VFR63_13850 [Gaiellaceae bacterium]|nr:hypothetical protein [Gaiellaceae bacterium]